MTYNSLIWENAENLPLPNEVKGLLADVKWDEYIWQSMGLPVNGATYSVASGKKLYLQELPTGETKVESEDFTGETIFGTYIVNPDKKENNYLLSFKVIFLKGDVVEVLLESLLPQPASEYEEVNKNIRDRLTKQSNMEKSWWFKWIYHPYRFAVRMIGVALVWILMALRWAVIKIVFTLTPL